MSDGDRVTSAAPSGRALLLGRVAASLVVLFFIAGTFARGWLESRLVLPVENPVEDAVIFIGFGMFAAMGALLVALRPGNTVGWILSAIGLMAGAFPASEAYAAFVMTTRGRPDALAVFGAWVNGWYWFALLGLVFVYLPLLFPDGRLPSRRWLPFAVLPGIGAVAVIVLGGLGETLRGQDVPYRIDNPIGIEGLAPVEELPVFGVIGFLLLVGAIGALASVAVRSRRSRGEERPQMKWFLYAVAPLLLLPLEILPVEGYVPQIVGNVMLGWVLVGLPTAIGISVLKYRLYDIDLVINRTLVYGSLTVTLALVYAGCVFSLQYVFRALTGQTSQLAVVASTLAIAALFGPLRRGVQAFIDRRFYRARYDAGKTLEAFGSRLRDETDLNSLGEGLAGVVRETVQPARVSLWLREPESARQRDRRDGYATGDSGVDPAATMSGSSARNGGGRP